MAGRLRRSNECRPAGDKEEGVRTAKLRSQSYRLARDIGNVRAASKGPTSYAKRVARRKVYRTTNGMTRHLLKSFGL